MVALRFACCTADVHQPDPAGRCHGLTPSAARRIGSGRRHDAACTSLPNTSRYGVIGTEGRGGEMIGHDDGRRRG